MDFIFVESKKRVVVDEECVITVNTADAGQGNITCRIRTPTDADADIDIVDNNDGTVSVYYTPHTPGTYGISVKFGGVPIPDGEYVVEVRRLDFVVSIHNTNYVSRGIKLEGRFEVLSRMA